MRRAYLWFAAALYCAGVLHAATPVILPQPQSVQYGSGSLAVSKLHICFSSSPAPEDRFAAEQLATGLARKTGVQVPIQDRCPTTSAILLHRTGPVDPLPTPGEAPGPTSREAYRLTISAKRIEIEGRSSAAVYYGAQTLLQLAESSPNAAFPVATIQDWPALAYRATLVDVGSEGPMSTMDQVLKQIDLVARWKGNQYFFYSEGNIELDGYPLLNPNARFTKEQIRQIIAYARERHIDVIPAVELYGHLHDLFRIEKYSDLADFPHGGEFNPANRRVQALLVDWVNQFAELFPSPFVDIGFDETWSIQKSSEQAGTGATPVKLFVQQLSDVTNLFQAHGKTVMAYADIMVKFPGIIAELPKGIIALPWWYDPSPDPEYKKWLSPLMASNVPNIVTPGVSSWDEIAPDFDMSFTNIDTLLAAGRNSHSLGLLNTLWTDDGQMLMQMSWPGIAYGAIAAWQSAPMQRSEFYANYSQSMYSKAAAPEVAQALTELNASEISLQTAIGHQETMLAFWQDPFAPGMLKVLQSHPEELHQCRLHAEQAQEHLYRAIALGEDRAGLSTFLVGAQMLDYAGMKYLYAVEIAQSWATLPPHPTKEQLSDILGHGISSETHSRTADLMDGISELKEPYKQAWLAQYTGYRLNSALGRWDAEYEYWRHAQVVLNDLLANFKDGDSLPPLDTLLTPAAK